MKKNSTNVRENNVIDLSKVLDKKKYFTNKSMEDFYEQDFKEVKLDIIDSLKKEKFIFSWDMIKQLFYYEKNVAFVLNYNKGDKIFNQNNNESRYQDQGTFCFAIYNMINLFENKPLKERNITRNINEYLDKHPSAGKNGLDFNQRIDFINSIKKNIFISTFNSADDIIQMLKENEIFTACIKLDKYIIATTITGFITNGKDYYLEVINTGQEIPVYIEANYFYKAYKLLDNLMFEEYRRNVVYKISKNNKDDAPCYITISKVANEPGVYIQNSPINLETRKCHILNWTEYEIEFVRSCKNLSDAKKEDNGRFPTKVDNQKKKIYIDMYNDVSYELI